MMERFLEAEKRKILIIDDSPEAIEVLGNALPSHYKRQFALNGEKALQLLTTSDELPDLILLDVVMPGLNGYKVCRLIKQDKRLSNIPVIFLSALSDVQDKIKAFENGGVDYIQKPFEVTEVNARVEIHLKLRHLQQELEKHNIHLNQLVEEKVKEISESQMATIYSLAKLAESRDDETGEHLKRIQVFCRMVAERLGNHIKYRSILDIEFINNLKNASPLHDIGKVGIKDSILLKPGKLTLSEFEEMKQHTTKGANTLKEVYQNYPNNRFVKIGIEIAQSHHEKWNGSGYPEGVSGNDIPLSARIMALADVYDALRSKRVYKDAYTHEKACEIIMEGRGNHFDPLIVDVFTEFEQDFMQVH